jgi:ATP-binding cassette subfamily B protein
VNDPQAILENVPLLRFVPPDVKQLVVSSFESRSFAFGEAIVREGEPADAFYILVSGRARVVKQGVNGQEVSLNVLVPGDSFGERALLDKTTRMATVRTSSEAHALRLDRAVFHALVAIHPALREYLNLHARHQDLHNFFRLYTAFARLPLDALRDLLAALRPVRVAAGEYAIRQGDPPGPMYIVRDGRLRIFIDEGGARRYVAYLRKGDFFGEISLFTHVPRTASVEAVSPCELLELGAATFEALVQRSPEFTSQIEARIAQYDYTHAARVPLDFADELLPADASVHEKVGIDQADVTGEPDSLASEGPFASDAGHFVKRRGRIRRFPLVRQIDEMDCGAACLAMVCRSYGRAVSLTRIRQLVHTSYDGSSLRALCTAAETLGLAARSVKASRTHLDEMPLPAIVHWEGNHWIVLYDVGRNRVRVADPGLGRRRLERHRFEEQWTGYAALFDYTPRFEEAPKGRAAFEWLRPLLGAHSVLIGQAVALAMVVSGLQMLLPVMTQVIVDRVLVDRDVALLHVLILTLALGLLFMLAAIVVQRYLLSLVAVRVDAASLETLTGKLLALPMTYFASRRTGDIQRRLAGVRQVREFFVENGVRSLTAIVQLLASIALMVFYSPLLAVVFLIAAPLYACMMRWSWQVLSPVFADLEEALGRHQSRQLDAIRGIETVKAMGAERSLRESMLNEFHGLARRQFKADFTMMSYDGTIQAVGFLSMVLFLWVGARQVMSGHLTVGGLVALNSLVAMAHAPILTLLTLWDSLQHCTVLLNRLSDIFEQEPEQGADHSTLMPVRTLEGRIRFEHVGFRYGGPESPKILDGVSFEAQPGAVVALVGRSGSGKSTLVKCLAGLLEPTEGTIRFDGIDLKTLNYRDLRSQIGFVLQDTHLFDETIARNIAFGEDHPDLDRVLWAARAAHAHEFVERLPLGYDTPIGESGLALSGGQQQRIAIARALYRRPAILVFDEATSLLDAESERLVQENMDRLLTGHTAIVIAHRLSTIRNADLILVLERGRIVEQGSHDDLMERQGLYYYLCSQQLGL